jgi:hypothetical protein
MRSIENDLRNLKWILVMLLLFGLFAAMAPILLGIFASPPSHVERSGYLIFIVCMFVAQLGFVTYRSVSSLHKRVLDLERQNAAKP